MSDYAAFKIDFQWVRIITSKLLRYSAALNFKTVINRFQILFTLI